MDLRDLLTDGRQIWCADHWRPYADGASNGGVAAVELLNRFMDSDQWRRGLILGKTPDEMLDQWKPYCCLLGDAAMNDLLAFVDERAPMVTIVRMTVNGVATSIAFKPRTRRAFCRVCGGVLAEIQADPAKGLDTTIKFLTGFHATGNPEQHCITCCPGDTACLVAQGQRP